MGVCLVVQKCVEMVLMVCRVVWLSTLVLAARAPARVNRRRFRCQSGAAGRQQNRKSKATALKECLTMTGFTGIQKPRCCACVQLLHAHTSPGCQAGEVPYPRKIRYTLCARLRSVTTSRTGLAAPVTQPATAQCEWQATTPPVKPGKTHAAHKRTIATTAFQRQPPPLLKRQPSCPGRAC